MSKSLKLIAALGLFTVVAACAQQQEEARRREEGQDQEQHRMNRVAGGYHQRPRNHGEKGKYVKCQCLDHLKLGLFSAHNRP